MRVLMLGWEFPPHISGGLGTACYGLANALTQRKIDLLFVTPFDFSNDNTQPIDSLPADSQNHVSKISSTPATSPEKNTGQIQQVRIQSYLNPYNQPHESSRQKPSLTQWNYNPHFKSSKPSNISDQGSEQFHSRPEISSVLNEVYKFGDTTQHFVKDFCFDIIHAHDWMTFDAAIRIKQDSVKPLVVHIHSTEFDRVGENGSSVVQEMERKGMEAADLVIAVSERTRNTIIEKYDIDKSKVKVVHNGVQPMFNGSVKNNPLGGKKVITFLGRVTYQKGPQYFVDAAYEVLKKFPDAHFVMGGAGDMLPSMMEKVASRKMSSNFHFTGFLNKEQVERIWSITNIYVMPSTSEPFGITPLEAMHAGIPVIISKQSGVAEVINQVVKVDFWNTSEIAGAISRLLSQPKLVKKLKAKSKQEVKKISWDAASKIIIKAYEKLLNHT